MIPILLLRQMNLMGTYRIKSEMWWSINLMVTSVQVLNGKTRHIGWAKRKKCRSLAYKRSSRTCLQYALQRNTEGTMKHNDGALLQSWLGKKWLKSLLWIKSWCLILWDLEIFHSLTVNKYASPEFFHRSIYRSENIKNFT